jgi:hypothetical protein
MKELREQVFTRGESRFDQACFLELKQLLYPLGQHDIAACLVVAALIDLACLILDYHILFSSVLPGDVELKDCIHALGGTSIEGLWHPGENLFDIRYRHVVLLSAIKPITMVV